MSERRLNRVSFFTPQKFCSIGPHIAATVARCIAIVLSSTWKQLGGGMFTLRRMICVGLASYSLAACAEVQMDYNVLTYDSAIADSANQLLLLNAVRASQHYPRSFTSSGALVGGPPVTGGIGSTFNFNQFSSLQNFSLTPSITAGAGYSQFTLTNLNFQEFMTQMRKPVSDDIIKAFRKDPAWPRQLLDLIYYQRFRDVPEGVVSSTDSRRKFICATSTHPYDLTDCDDIMEQIAKYEAWSCDRHFSDPIERMRDFRNNPRTYYNTASNYCQFARFRIFLEEVRLVENWQQRQKKVVQHPICLEDPKPGCLPADPRSALDMIGYLGELIAAQNYIERPFIPGVQFGAAVGTGFKFIDVPLFVVVRGEPLGNAAVIVRHNGVPYFIPRPDFGSMREERSLQTLELVLQTVQAATQQKDLPTAVPPVAVLK